MSVFESLTMPHFSEPVEAVFEDPNTIIGGLPIKEVYKKIKDGSKNLSNWGLNLNVRGLKEQLEPVINKLLEALKSVLNDFAYLANELIKKSEALVRDLINDVFKNLADLVSNIWEKVSDLLNQAVSLGERLILKISELTDKFITNLKEFRQALFEDLNTLINNAEAAADRILYRGQVLATGTIEQITSEIKQIALSLQDFFDNNPFSREARKRKKISEKIKKHFSIDLIPIIQWGRIQTYDYLCCYTLMVESHEIENKRGTERIGNVETIYADLQDKAWRLSTLGRDDSSLSKEAMEDWVKYGQLYELWHKLGDENMELLDAINDKLKELDQAKAEFEEKSALIESLRIQLQDRSTQIDSLKNGLANGGIADGLHKHSTLTGSGGSPDPALSMDNSGNIRLLGNIGIGTKSTESTLSIGSSNFTLDKSEASPNAGYIRFGDNTGWKFHIGRSKESVPGSFNQGTTGVLMTIQDNGNVGIGTANPREKLDVVGDVTIAGKLGTNGLSSKPIHAGWGGGIHTWDVEAEGSIWCKNGIYSAAGVFTTRADLAENYPADMDLELGDVVCLDKDKDIIVLSEKPNDPLVIGIVSTKPGFTLNAKRDAKETKMFPVALCGRVPCKVVDENGPIRRGDLLTSSSAPGHAMKANPLSDEKLFCSGTIIGKAIGKFESGKGVIDIFVFSS